MTFHYCEFGNNPLDRLLALEVFVGVAERGSFAAAARALRISPSAATRAIAELEARHGTPLLHRSTRAVALTGAGSAFLPVAQRVLADLAEGERALAGVAAEPQGQLLVTAPVLFGRLHVLPVATELIDRHPALSIELMLVDRNIRIVEEGVDVAVRIGKLADSALRALRIGQVRQTIVASPAYLARFGVPQSATDLDGHRLIGSSGPRAPNEWRLGERQSFRVAPRLRVNSVASAVAAAEAGTGIANLLSYQVAEAIAAGRLIELLAPDTPEWLPVSLLFDGSRGRSAALQAFVAAMRTGVAGWLGQTGQ